MGAAGDPAEADVVLATAHELGVVAAVAVEEESDRAAAHAARLDAGLRHVEQHGAEIAAGAGDEPGGVQLDGLVRRVGLQLGGGRAGGERDGGRGREPERRHLGVVGWGGSIVFAVPRRHAMLFARGWARLRRAAGQLSH